MLYHDFLTNKEQTIHKWVHYFPIYERYLSKFRNQSVVVWEIGVFKGGSAQMLRRYLGPFAQIIGIDINPECRKYADNQTEICIGDQSDIVFLQSLIDKYGVPDVVIDDGSHVMNHIIKTFEFLYDKVSKNGIYLVEDLHTSYWDEYEGGLRRKGTFIEYCKDKIDALNARYNDLDNYFAKTTFSMSFFDSVVVFEKMQWRPGSIKSIKTPRRGNSKDFKERGYDFEKVIFYGAGRYLRDKYIDDNKYIL